MIDAAGGVNGSTHALETEDILRWVPLGTMKFSNLIVLVGVDVVVVVVASFPFVYPRASSAVLYV